MMRNGNRTITVSKSNLISKIQENKKNHVAEYEKAVIAYKQEALRQLEVQIKDVEDGSLNAKLDLVTPINNSDNYDKIIKMFNWEINTDVELTQDEFNEYVLDETPFAMSAKYANSSYLAG